MKISKTEIVNQLSECETKQIFRQWLLLENEDEFEVSTYRGLIFIKGSRNPAFSTFQSNVKKFTKYYKQIRLENYKKALELLEIYTVDEQNVEKFVKAIKFIRNK